MAIDIHIHIEYKKRKKNKYSYGGYFKGDRIYGVFSVLAGIIDYQPPLYPLRGLPGDITKETLRDYQIGKCDWHDVGWLTPDELGDCLKEADRRYSDEDEDDAWLRPYWILYEYMMEHENYGEQTRMIFWFDN